MKPIYRIRDWDEHFENSESRKIKATRFVLIPVKHDGKGYRRVVAHPRGAEILGAWMVIVQVAAKMPNRGVLADEDGPLSAEDLHFISGLPEELFQAAFTVLTSPGINWLESDDLPESPGISRNLPAVRDEPGETPVEQNRTEQKGMEGNDGGTDPPARTRFVPPTVEQVREYCLSRSNAIDPEHFVDYYTARGWKLSRGSAMKDWESAVRTWEKNGYGRDGPAKSKPGDSRVSAVDDWLEMRKGKTDDG